MTSTLRVNRSRLPICHLLHEPNPGAPGAGNEITTHGAVMGGNTIIG